MILENLNFKKYKASDRYYYWTLQTKKDIRRIQV